MRGFSYFQRVFPMVLAVRGVFSVAGCNPDSGAVSQEVVYPSGYARTPYTWGEPIPVEGTDWLLQPQKAADYDKTHAYDLQFLDGDGALLYELPGVGRPTMRGEAAEGGAVWLCSEWWNTVHCNGYMDGSLTQSLILLVDTADGEVLFQEKAGAGELYLTSEGTRCYFYESGEPERIEWFGLVRTPEKNARVFFRDALDWQNPQTVYVFDYVYWPDVASYQDSRLKTRFCLEESGVRVAWESTGKILTSDGKYLPVFSEKAVYEVPFESGAAAVLAPA